MQVSSGMLVGIPRFVLQVVSPIMLDAMRLQHASLTVYSVLQLISRIENRTCQDNISSACGSNALSF